MLWFDWPDNEDDSTVEYKVIIPVKMTYHSMKDVERSRMVKTGLETDKYCYDN